MEEDILCAEDPNRYCLFPIRYHDIWEAYKRHKNAFWTAEEIDFTADKNDWERLNHDEKHFVEHILAFFAGSDGIVLENLVKNFCQEITLPEARCFYAFQAMMENIHCCPGDTTTLTRGGWERLDALAQAAKEVDIWNGEEFTPVMVVGTGVQPLMRVTFNTGHHLDATPDHTWYLQVEGLRMKVKTSQLMPGDHIYPYTIPHEALDDVATPAFLRGPITTENVYVRGVTPLDGKSMTYCFNEPKRHCGVFNGVLTGQSEVYSLMIDTYSPHEKKQHLFHAVSEIPCIKKKADWALRWINGAHEFGKRLFAFGIVEGVFFSGSFCAIFWLKERGLMTQSLGKSNEWIARDESLHTQFAVLLYKYVRQKINNETAQEMMREAVEVEEEFICRSLPVSLIGMNAVLMAQYIKFVADRLLVQFGYTKIWGVANPFPFMEKISLDGKTNFFEQRVTEYSSGRVGGLSFDDLGEGDF